MRSSLRHCLTEEEVLAGARAAFEAGIEKIKLYFMIGLPTETDEDIRGIVDLANRIAALGKETFKMSGKNKKRIRITASVATFIPKPNTPFEDEGQISIDETLAKQRFLKQNIISSGVVPGARQNSLVSSG